MGRVLLAQTPEARGHGGLVLKRTIHKDKNTALAMRHYAHDNNFNTGASDRPAASQKQSNICFEIKVQNAARPGLILSVYTRTCTFIAVSWRDTRPSYRSSKPEERQRGSHKIGWPNRQRRLRFFRTILCQSLRVGLDLQGPCRPDLCAQFVQR